MLPTSGLVMDLGGGNHLFAEAAALARPCLQVVSFDFAEGSSPQETSGSRHERRLVDLNDPASVENLLSDYAGKCDVLTAFQVLEHLPQPTDLLLLMRQLARPSALLALSVPNRKRFDVSPYQALDCPPHHVS